MRWQYEQLVADAVTAWVAAEVPDAEPGWGEDAVYRITAMKKPERWWTVGVDVPVSSGTMHLEVFVSGEGDGTAQVVSARRPGRGRMQETTFSYNPDRGWYEDVTEQEPTLLRMV